MSIYGLVSAFRTPLHEPPYQQHVRARTDSNKHDRCICSLDHRHVMRLPICGFARSHVVKQVLSVLCERGDCHCHWCTCPGSQTDAWHSERGSKRSQTKTPVTMTLAFLTQDVKNLLDDVGSRKPTTTHAPYTVMP